MRRKNILKKEIILKILEKSLDDRKLEFLMGRLEGLTRKYCTW